MIRHTLYLDALPLEYRIGAMVCIVVVIALTLFISRKYRVPPY